MQILKYCFIVVPLFFITGCQKEPINFDFSGREMIYSNFNNNENELILFNIDTKEKITLNHNIEEVDHSSFVLFDYGKKIFVNSYNSPTGEIYIYDIQKEMITEINIHKLNQEMAGFSNVSIFNNRFYFSSQNKIFAHSLENFKLLETYTLDSLISQFAVFNEDLIAINFTSFDMENSRTLLSNIYLYDFKNSTKKEIPFRGYLYGWSKNREHLLFNSGGLKIMDYPTCIVNPINIIKDEGLEVYNNVFFISDNEIVFTGSKKKNFNLYGPENISLLDLKTKRITEILKTNGTTKIESTFY